MARRKTSTPPVDWLFPAAANRRDSEPSSLLDVVDSLLNKGVVVNGDIVLGVANVDLIYAKASVLLAALDRVMSAPVPQKQRRRRTKKR